MKHYTYNTNAPSGKLFFIAMLLVGINLISCSKQTEKSEETKENKITRKSVHKDLDQASISTDQSKKDTLETDKRIVPPAVKPVIYILPDPPEPGPGPYFRFDPIMEPPVEVLTVEHSVFQDTVVQFADILPQFPGGELALLKFIQSNLIYPDFEKENEIEGTVYVQFIISKEGKAVSPKILRSVKDSKNFDKEVIRIVKSFPDWTPGEHAGQKVHVYFTMPVKFRLD